MTTDRNDGTDRRGAVSDVDFEALVLRTVQTTVQELQQQHQPACLSAEEQSWVRLALAREARREALQRAIIEKSLTGLVWAALVGFGFLVLDFLRNHGLKV